MPPLLESRPRGVQYLLAIGGPALLGALAGVLAGLSEPAYVAVSLLAAVGAVLAGLEHNGPGQGALRGFTGGLLFGTFILVALAITGEEPKAKLPDPRAVLLAFTVVIGIGLSALGGWWRSRREAAG